MPSARWAAASRSSRLACESRIPFAAPVVPELKPGEYRLYCRTIDANGAAQPMPRPFPKSGNNALHELPLLVKDA